VDPFEYHRLGLSKRDTQAAFRRQVRLQIYLPLLLGLLGLAAMVAAIWRSQYGDTSIWADISLSLLLLVGFALGILLLVVLASAAVGAWYLIRELPRPFRQAQIAIARAEHSTEQIADRAMLPLIVPKAAWHAMLRTLRYLMGIFKRRPS
jgi:hypothetical protein